MDDLYTYQIELGGLVNETDLNLKSPVRMVVEGVDPAATRLYIQTDQSGLIGLMRHLHARGFVFLSMSRKETDNPGSAPCHS